MRVTLAEPELEWLRRLPDDLRAMLSSRNAGPDDAVMTRLFPRAYLDPTEEQAERDWEEFVQPELLRERLAALELLRESLDRAKPAKGDLLEIVLVDDEVSAWLGVLNDTRLVLGIQLGVTEETDYEQLDPEDPNTPIYEVYYWLTSLQGELVDELL